MLTIYSSSVYEDDEIGETKIMENQKPGIIEDATLTASITAAQYNSLTDTIINSRRLNIIRPRAVANLP